VNFREVDIRIPSMRFALSGKSATSPEYFRDRQGNQASPAIPLLSSGAPGAIGLTDGALLVLLLRAPYGACHSLGLPPYPFLIHGEQLRGADRRHLIVAEVRYRDDASFAETKDMSGFPGVPFGKLQSERIV